jgi:heme/copper-type cytochrome/quinol oxidase subunit 4
MKQKVPTSESTNLRRSERYLVAALVSFSLAIVVLSVVLFSLNPQSVAGIIAVCCGVILMIVCITCFVLYNHFLKKEEESIPA